MNDVQIVGTNGGILNAKFMLEQPPEGRFDINLTRFGESVTVNITLNREQVTSLIAFMTKFQTIG